MHPIRPLSQIWFAANTTHRVWLEECTAHPVTCRMLRVYANEVVAHAGQDMTALKTSRQYRPFGVAASHAAVGRMPVVSSIFHVPLPTADAAIRPGTARRSQRQLRFPGLQHAGRGAAGRLPGCGRARATAAFAVAGGGFGRPGCSSGCAAIWIRSAPRISPDLSLLHSVLRI